MSFNKFTRTTTDATFTVTVGVAGPAAIGDVLLVDGGSGYLEGDTLTSTDGTTGTLLVITVTGITTSVSYSPTTLGVGGAISAFTYTDNSDWVAADDDGDYVIGGATLSDLTYTDFVNHTEYESGGNVSEYIDGTGLLIEVTAVSSTVVTGVTLGTTDASKNYIAGTQVRVIQGDEDSALISIDTVSATGVVETISIIDGGSGYTAADDLVASQVELKTDAPEVYWQGTMTGVFNPATAPSTGVSDNDPRISVARPADAPQLSIQKRYIDGGETTVWAEPTLVNAEGDVVGNTLRAEDCVDRPRCEANGFIWTVGTTGDADGGNYGYCREFTVAESVTFWAGIAESYSDCPAGTMFDDADSCVALDSTAATGADLINAAVLAEDIKEEKAMRDCEVSGNFWDISTATCIAGDTPANFDLATFTFGTVPDGQTASSNGTNRDYLANACRNLDYIWKYDTNTCVVEPTLTALTTQSTCVAAGCVWIAGTCYNPNDFGDGHNRNATSQQDPNVDPK